jgi:hypothetical protein
MYDCLRGQRRAGHYHLSGVTVGDVLLITTPELYIAFSDVLVITVSEVYRSVAGLL